MTSDPTDTDPPAVDPDVDRVLAVAETSLLGEGGRYRPADVYEGLDADPEDIRRLWRAMGFVDVPDHEPRLTAQDLGALHGAISLIEEHAVEADQLLQHARTVGRAVSRIADAQVAALAARARQEGVDDPNAQSELLALSLDLYIPMFQELVVYAYRRHLLASVERVIAANAGVADTRTACVGFADLVGFSASAQQLTDQDLAALLEVFEARATDVVGRHGGRVVKMIGDEVMFVTAHPDDAAEIALTLVEAVAAESTSQLRAGVAHGTTLNRHGDYFGPTVNLASRLVGIANPGSVIIGPAVRDALDQDRFFTKKIRGRDLKGVGYVEPWVLRRFDPNRA